MEITYVRRKIKLQHTIREKFTGAEEFTERLKQLMSDPEVTQIQALSHGAWMPSRSDHIQDWLDFLDEGNI